MQTREALLPSTTDAAPTNADIAAQLERVAELLDAQHANAYRVRAYRAAAATLRGLAQPAHKILEAEGLAGLEKLPTIGASIARAIGQALHSAG